MHGQVRDPEQRALVVPAEPRPCPSPGAVMGIRVSPPPGLASRAGASRVGERSGAALGREGEDARERMPAPPFGALPGCFQRRSLLLPPLWHPTCGHSLHECPSARQRGERRLESARFIDETRAERMGTPLCERIQASAAGWPPPNSAATALCRLI